MNSVSMEREKILKDFPILTKQEGFTYLDSAATSLTPECVIESMNTYYRTYRANIHRGLYREAQKATDAYEKARAQVAQFVGAHKDEIIFTAGATNSSNMLFYSLEFSGLFQSGDEIVTTVEDHHAVLLPTQAFAKRKGLTIRYVPLSRYTLAYDAFDTLITKKTKVVVLPLASNVLGIINDIAHVARRAREVGALIIVDATAALGHTLVSVEKLDADFIFFSGHKMCGPTGVGVLYGKKEALSKLEPCFLGGGIIEDVTRTEYTLASEISRFEAGTPNIAGVIGLANATTYLAEIGVENIQTHVQTLTRYAYEKLSEIEGIKIFTQNLDSTVGILSFSLPFAHPHDVAEILGKEGIAVRAGHHCALPLHTELGISASTRASFHFYNTKKDADALFKGIKKVHHIFS